MFLLVLVIKYLLTLVIVIVRLGNDDTCKVGGLVAHSS